VIRENRSEILEQAGISSRLVERAYRDLALVHRWMGDTRFVIGAIRRDPLPVRRVLDVGCGTGIVLEQVRRALGVRAVGVDLRLYPRIATPVPILQANASCDSLPRADVAYCMHLGHHLSESALTDMIRNVGRSCRRFILLDLVRHPLPLFLFRLFVAPWLCAIDAEDGKRSIRRSYTPAELHEIAGSALAGTEGTFQLTVAPGNIRQVLDISYNHTHFAPAGRQVLCGAYTRLK
jgi:2-polyprenyl-3-methyl-5-hydroxy-6-metoxy-1,4-benzoquinol methylase